MYKKRINTKKKIINISVTAIILVILLTISLLLPRNENTLLKDITIYIQKVVLSPLKTFNSEKDIDQSESYLIQKNVNASLEKEIQELKQALELNSVLTEYEIINSTVISRNKSYWLNTFTIDKGKSSGIEPNMAVITRFGLIGKITKVSNDSSEVKLITADDVNFKVSVAIKTNEIDNFAILNGYDKETGLITATGIDKTTYINVGDPVLTSGLGSMFPAGIYIGDIVDIKSDKYNLSKTVYIRTLQNFDDIHYVSVLKVK